MERRLLDDATQSLPLRVPAGTWLLLIDERRARVYVADRAGAALELDDALSPRAGETGQPAAWVRRLADHLRRAWTRRELRALVLVGPRALLRALRRHLGGDLDRAVIADAAQLDDLPQPLQPLVPAPGGGAP